MFTWLENIIYPPGSVMGDKYRRVDWQQVHSLGQIADNFIHAPTEQAASEILCGILARQRIQGTTILGPAGIALLAELRQYR
jgi:hypothetical protein